MNLKKSKLYMLLLICILLLMPGCKPKGDPTQVITSYYQNVKDGNFDAAYDCLASDTMNNISKDDFNELQKTNRELWQFKDFKITKVSEQQKETVDGNEYSNVVKFNVIENNLDYYKNKEQSNTVDKYVINDNGNWKLLRSGNINEDIANNYFRIGGMYSEGKGKEMNQIAAIENLNKALSKCDIVQAHYSLGYVYNKLNRNDEAIEQENIYIEKAPDDKAKSNAYNIIGCAYLGKNDFKQAKASFQKALELNPNNEYAKNNLSRLQ